MSEKTILSTEQMGQFMELYKEGDGWKTISKKLQISVGVVRRVLEELKLPVGKNRIFPKDKILFGIEKELSEYQLKQIQQLYDEGFTRTRICEKIDIGRRILDKAISQLNIVYSVQPILPTQRECEKCLITLPISNFTKRVCNSGRVEFAFNCIKCAKEIWDNKPKIERLKHKESNDE
jgi:hypothetical protein